VSAYEPGLLAAAHRGVLYVDEVNLLHDHLVDLLLDARRSGRSYVEREGVSVQHAARFLLVGTMNPEEGELRPQLLDRFGLTVEVTATRDPLERAEVVRRRLAYEADPDGFAQRFAADDADLAASIAAAASAARGRARRPRAAGGHDGLRRLRRRRAARRPRHRQGRRRARRLGRPHRGDHRRRPHRRAPRAAAPRGATPFEAPGLDEQQLDDALDSVPPAARAGPEDGPTTTGPQGGGRAEPRRPRDGAPTGGRGAGGRARRAPARAPSSPRPRPARPSRRSRCRCRASTAARAPRAAVAHRGRQRPPDG
jgi:magnesium chelatase subunit D